LDIFSLWKEIFLFALRLLLSLIAKCCLLLQVLVDDADEIEKEKNSKGH